MNLVATFNFGDVDYARYTVPYMRAYAERVGADFIEYKQFPNRSHYPSPPGWFHLEALRLFREQSYYQNLLLLDADQLVLPACPNVFEQVGDCLVAVQDMGMPEGGPHYADWCRQTMGETPVSGPYFNGGMLLLSLSTAKRLERCLAGPYPDGCDQDFLNQRVRRFDRVQWWPHEFNWLAPQFRDGALQKYIVHFVGGHKRLLADFVRRLPSPDAASKAGQGGARSLADMGRETRSDKGSDHSYLEVYDQIFDRFRDRPIRLLEIGVLGGESLRLWQRYFPRAEITGIDIALNGLDVPGCQLVECDQTDRRAIEELWPDEHFDLIIDDGSHRVADQLQSLCYLWPKLRSGGLYIVEDVENAALTKYFQAFRPLVLDRSARRARRDDILIILPK